MPINSDKPVNILSFYSDADEELYRELSKYLALSKAQGLFDEVWHNHEFTNIEEHVNKARIILILLSVDFLLSEYAKGTEVKRALERHEAGEARVVPIILRPVHFENTPFGRFQVFVGAKAVTIWPNRDEAYFNIIGCMRMVVADIRVW